MERAIFIDSRPMHGVRGALMRVARFPAALLRDLLDGDLNMRAMSLVYTTLLSIVPLMAFSFSILKGLGEQGGLESFLMQFFRPMGPAAVELTSRVMGFVDNVRGGVLGSLGVAFLLYTVITTIQKVESSFNFVWRVEKPRSWGRRLSEYISVMIIAPIVLFSVVGLFATAQSTALSQWLQRTAGLGPAFDLIAQVGPYVIVAAFFSFAYSFIPNTRVRILPALLGGVFAGVLWALVGRVFATFIAYSTQMTAIYTGFAIVLSVLVWIYLNWLILLTGAQLSFYAQYPQYLPHGHHPVELTGRAREYLGVSAMHLIGRDYAQGRTRWTTSALASELDVPGVALASVLSSLESAELLLATEKEFWVPARAMENIHVLEIIDASRSAGAGRVAVNVHATSAVSAMMDDIDQAIRERVGRRTLSDLIQTS